jgi:hypothetical protein
MIPSVEVECKTSNQRHFLVPTSEAPSSDDASLFGTGCWDGVTLFDGVEDLTGSGDV